MSALNLNKRTYTMAFHDELKVMFETINVDKELSLRAAVFVAHDSACVFCLESLRKSAKSSYHARTLCGHQFHKECLNKGFNQNLTKCPLCRKSTSPSTCKFVQANTICPPSRSKRGKTSRAKRRETQRASASKSRTK